MLEVNGVAAVEVFLLGNSRNISIEDGSSIAVGGESEAISVLSKAVQVGVLGEVGSETQVLVLDNESCCRGIEENFLVGPAGNLEREGVLLHVKVELDSWAVDVV